MRALHSGGLPLVRATAKQRPCQLTVADRSDNKCYRLRPVIANDVWNSRWPEACACWRRGRSGRPVFNLGGKHRKSAAQHFLAGGAGREMGAGRSWRHLRTPPLRSVPSRRLQPDPEARPKPSAAGSRTISPARHVSRTDNAPLGLHTGRQHRHTKRSRRPIRASQRRRLCGPFLGGHPKPAINGQLKTGHFE